MPHNLSIETLLNNQHVSQPRNKLVTQAFYDLGKIERLGSDIQRIFDIFEEAGLSKFLIEEAMGGFKVTMYMARAEQSMLNEVAISYNIKQRQLSKHQVKAIGHATEHGK